MMGSSKEGGHMLLKNKKNLWSLDHSPHYVWKLGAIWVFN